MNVNTGNTICTNEMCKSVLSKVISTRFVCKHMTVNEIK